MRCFCDYFVGVYSSRLCGFPLSFWAYSQSLVGYFTAAFCFLSFFQCFLRWSTALPNRHEFRSSCLLYRKDEAMPHLPPGPLITHSSLCGLSLLSPLRAQYSFTVSYCLETPLSLGSGWWQLPDAASLFFCCVLAILRTCFSLDSFLHSSCTFPSTALNWSLLWAVPVVCNIEYRHKIQPLGTGSTAARVMTLSNLTGKP